MPPISAHARLRLAPLVENPPAAQDVESRAHARLRAQPYRAIRDLQCQFASGRLTVAGIVASYHLKQVALAALVELDGVVDLADQIEVRYSVAAREPARQ